MDRHCPICGLSSDDTIKMTHYVRCSFCGTRSVTHLPKRKIILKNLNKWAEGICNKEDINLSPSNTVCQRILSLTRLRPAGKELLDVGCGKADFLLMAKKAGFHVSGMDIAEPVIRQLIRYAIRPYRSFSDIRDNTFDVVTCFDVIEHTTDPKKLLKEICRITKNKGILLLSTPNAGSLSARVLGESWWVFGPEGHYVLCTPKGIRILLEKNGYFHIEIRTNTLTQWLHTKSQSINKIGNKIIYCILFPFFPLLFQLGLGDNIEISAKKK